MILDNPRMLETASVKLLFFVIASIELDSPSKKKYSFKSLRNILSISSSTFDDWIVIEFIPSTFIIDVYGLS